MIIRNIFLLFSCCLMSLSIYGQGSIHKKADKAFDTGEYYKATELYKKAYTRSNERDEKTEISFKMANCAMSVGNYKQAETYYKRTIKLRYIEMFKDPSVMFLLGQALKGQEKYDEAIVKFEEYALKDGADKKMANEAIESCQMAKEWISTISRYKLQNVRKINSKFNDFLPMYGGKKNDELWFTSSREEAVGKSINKQTNEDFNDIFFTKQKKSKKKKKKDLADEMPDWLTPTNGFVELSEKEQEDYTESKVKDVENPFGLQELNQKDSEEGHVTFTKGSKKMFFTKNVFKKNEKTVRKIYSAELRSGSFGEIFKEQIPFDSINGEPVDITTPAISPDGKVLYFASRSLGGEGGSDLYRCVFDRKKKNWGEPQNLGATINTYGDEGFPYLSPSGALFFSSTGHIGMGGLDIFRSEVIDDGFTEPENLKYPLNTAYDDFGITFEDEKEEKGYLSSNRKGSQWKSRGGADIYFIDKQLVFFTLDGYLMDTTLNEPISGARVDLIGPIPHSTITDGNGYYKFDLDKFVENGEYQIQVSQDWYLTQRDTITTSYDHTNRNDCALLDNGNLRLDLNRDFQMKNIRRPIILPEVQYDLGKATLREEGKKALDELADLLKNDHPDIVIELRSHTDLRGSKKLNKTLSESRAQSCVDYLVEQGISSDRLIAVGRSFYEPFEDEEGNKFTKDYISSLPISLQEDAHQKNRRTDFKVLSTSLEDYKDDMEKEERLIKSAIIDEEGNLIEITD